MTITGEQRSGRPGSSQRIKSPVVEYRPPAENGTERNAHINVIGVHRAARGP